MSHLGGTYLPNLDIILIPRGTRIEVGQWQTLEHTLGGVVLHTWVVRRNRIVSDWWWTPEPMWVLLGVGVLRRWLVYHWVSRLMRSEGDQSMKSRYTPIVEMWLSVHHWLAYEGRGLRGSRDVGRDL